MTEHDKHFTKLQEKYFKRYILETVYADLALIFFLFLLLC